MVEKKIDQNKPFFLKGSNEVGVLLLHGWTSPPGEFLPLAEYLHSHGYTVLAPLLRGHGTKPEDLLGVEWKDWLADAQKALEELKKYSSKIFVGGISMGGNLAMLLSEDETVEGIILMGTSVKYRFHLMSKIAIFFMGLWKTYRRKYYPPWVRKKMGQREVYPYYPVKNVKEVIRLAEVACKRLSQITKPLLIMQSTADHLVSKKSPQIIFNGVKSKIKEIFWVENAYHIFVEEKKIWEKIREFIEIIQLSKSK